MLDLLQHYSLPDILVYTIFLALAIKSLVSFLQWSNNMFKKLFNKQQKQINEKEDIEKRLQRGSEVIETLQKNQQQTEKKLGDLSDKIDMLIDSDKDDIKAYITRQHHYFCYQRKWIDDFSLDCLQRRYQHYADEGGNSFIGGFMEQLRALPKQPPLDQ